MHTARYAALFVMLFLSPLAWLAGNCSAQEPARGPTPYPQNDKDWPGRGPIRKFGWMVDNRNHFWSQREKAKGAIVFCGDSLTGNWKELEKAFAGLKVANRGIGGDTSRGLLFRFKEDVLDLNPTAIVITVGTNDLTAHAKPADAIFNIDEMLKQVEQKDAKLPVILCTTPPSDNPKAPLQPNARKELNEAIRKLAGEHKNVTLVDLHAALANEDGSPKLENFAADKLHLAAPGYAKWAQLLKPVLEKLESKK